MPGVKFCYYIFWTKLCLGVSSFVDISKKNKKMKFKKDFERFLSKNMNLRIRNLNWKDNTLNFFFVRGTF